MEGTAEQINTAAPPATPERVEVALKNLASIHAEHGITELVVIAILKDAPTPVVMTACSNVERAALLARFAGEGLSHAAIGNMLGHGAEDA
jgi:uncharacterized protein YgbK (DUF1537 family)